MVEDDKLEYLNQWADVFIKWTNDSPEKISGSVLGGYLKDAIVELRQLRRDYSEAVVRASAAGKEAEEKEMLLAVCKAQYEFLKQELREAREVLQFYGQVSNHITGDLWTPIRQDAGARARACLGLEKEE